MGRRRAGGVLVTKLTLDLYAQIGLVVLIARHAVSTHVFAGMVAATVIRLFLIPMLYVVFEGMREWTHWRLGDGAAIRSSTPVSQLNEPNRGLGGSTFRIRIRVDV